MQRRSKGLAAAVAAYAPKYAAEHITPPKTTRELARARVSYQNGTFAMLGELRVTVDCTETIYPGMKSGVPGMADRPSSDVTLCTAGTRFYSAPSAQLTSVLALWDAPGMGAVGNQAWQQAWVQHYQQQANQAEAKNIAATNAAMKAQQQMFQQSMAAQAQMHQQFLAQMQASTNASMANANASMNAQSTVASDWVNYALDQQTVLDPRNRPGEQRVERLQLHVDGQHRQDQLPDQRRERESEWSDAGDVDQAAGGTRERDAVGSRRAWIRNRLTRR
jgi:hypothetical protein